MKNIFATITLGIFTLLLCNNTAVAQFGIGASFERNVNSNNVTGVPENGFGVRIENGIGPKLPLFALKYRIHASAFNAEYDFSDRVSDLTNRNIESNVYDFGAALLAEIKIPFIANPYAGLGIGYEVQNINALTNIKNDGGNDLLSVSNTLTAIETNSFYYNAFVGLKFTPIPILHPFIEYRYSGFTELDAITDSPGRLQIGIMLDF